MKIVFSAIFASFLMIGSFASAHGNTLTCSKITSTAQDFTLAQLAFVKGGGTFALAPTPFTGSASKGVGSDQMYRELCASLVSAQSVASKKIPANVRVILTFPHAVCAQDLKIAANGLASELSQVTCTTH